MSKILVRFGLLLVAAVSIGAGGWIVTDRVRTSHAAEAGGLEAGQEAARAGRYDEAFVIFDRLAWRGDPTAQYLLGEMYHRGLHVHTNWQAAEMWWTRAAEQNVADAAIRLGDYYARINRRGEPEPEQAARWYLRAAELGDGYGQARIGARYIRGEGIEQNAELGRQWLERAIADSNSRLAKFNLGEAYRDGVFGSPDDRLAVYWCLEGGKDGSIYSLRCAIHLMTNQDSVAVDFEAAYQWALVHEAWGKVLGFSGDRTVEFVLHGRLPPAPRNVILGQEIAPAQEMEPEFPEPRLDAAGQARARARAEAILKCWPEPPIGPDFTLQECYERHSVN